MRNNFNSKKLSKTEVAEVVTNHVSNEETEVWISILISIFDNFPTWYKKEEIGGFK